MAPGWLASPSPSPIIRAMISTATASPIGRRWQGLGPPFGKPRERRTPVLEDIADMEPVVTEHTIPRHWCPPCKKMFEPPVAAALPTATFGHRPSILVIPSSALAKLMWLPVPHLLYLRASSQLTDVLCNFFISGSKHSPAGQFLNLPGAKIETLQKQFGHSELKTTVRYAKLRGENLLDIFRARGVSGNLTAAGIK